MRQDISRGRIGLLIGSLLAAIVGMLLIDPIPQDVGYHAFADTRGHGGIHNFADTISNLGFLIVGLAGLWCTAGPGSRSLFADRREATPYLVFFIGVAAVAIGSAYYHLAPDNGRLFWDRLPMTVGFTGLFAAFIADRIAPRAITWLLPLLVLSGVASLLYWDVTEAAGRGDLRFYALVQFYPVLALPLICWLFPRGRLTCGRHLTGIAGFYLLAKLLEHFDHQIFDLLGGTISGHTLKHLAAATAAGLVIAMLHRRAAPQARFNRPVLSLNWH